MPTAPSPAAAVSPMLPRPFLVESVRRETRDTRSVRLRPAKGAPPPGFLPGQFNMLYALGIGEVPLSISADGGDGSITHTIRAAGAVTGALCALKPGDQVGLRGPFGRPWPLERLEGRDVVLMAGGIGLAPLRPAVQALLKERGRYGRLFLLYGARSPADLLFARELRAWAGRLDVEVTVDLATKGWRGPVGVVTSLLSRPRLEPVRTAALLCGPEVMMRFCAGALLCLGLRPGDIHLSLERNMKCAVGFCGHCQLGPAFLCKDGPVFSWESVESWLGIRHL